MPKAGGSSTITEVDFEAWFVALKFTDAFFDEALQVKPQAQTYIDPKTQGIEITTIDDIYVTSPSKNEFYNLKFRAPNIKSWSINDLKSQKILFQLKAQFIETPDAFLYFVTQSPCPIFHEIIPRGASCSSREELEIKLRPNNYINEWDNLRIIISCRTFDLKYDPLLRSFEEKHIIDVGDLSEEDVEFVLSRMGLEKHRVSKTLMDLLKVPLHLKVFCDIYEKETNLASLNTLQDLYDGLWDQHILTAIDRSSVLDTIVIATEKMDESKSLAIPFALLDRNNAGRQHLLSQSILIQQKKTLQFFHKSFFDYCYSRTFLNRHDSLIGVVLQQHQGLFVRPQIKQVLAYLRGSDFPKYLKELKEFLGNKNVRFHIWLLVVNRLAFVEDPTDEEWQIIKPLLDTETDFRKHFIDALQSEQWLKYLITNRYIHTFLKSLDNKLVNIVVWKLRSLINSFTDTIVDFIYDFPGIERKNESIWNILAGLDHWKSNKAVELLEGKLKALKRSPDHDYYYYHFLKSLFPYKPEIVCRIFFDDLDEKLDEIRSPDEFDKRGFCAAILIMEFNNIF